MEPRVSIGDFAAAVHMSVKTLRHYHEVGLLEPSEVDPTSGYRYYSHEQIPAAQVIRRLRDLDMPVAELKAVLAAPDPDARHQLISEHLGRLETKLAETTSAVNELQGLLGRPKIDRPVEHRTVASTPAAAIHDVVDREDVLAWWHGALGELRATLTGQRLHQAGPSGGLYSTEIFEHDRGAATVFVPVEGATRAIGPRTSTSAMATSAAMSWNTRSTWTVRFARTTCAASSTRTRTKPGTPKSAGPSFAPTELGVSTARVISP